jgi:hypothetical protein
VKTWGVDRWGQRMEQPESFRAGHSRDDTGRFRTLSDGRNESIADTSLIPSEEQP